MGKGQGARGLSTREEAIVVNQRQTMNAHKKMDDCDYSGGKASSNDYRRSTDTVSSAKVISLLYYMYVNDGEGSIKNAYRSTDSYLYPFCTVIKTFTAKPKSNNMRKKVPGGNYRKLR